MPDGWPVLLYPGSLRMTPVRDHARGRGAARGACTRQIRAATKESDMRGEYGERDGFMDTGRQALWQEEPAVRRRMADPVRTAAVRAVIIAAVTLTQAMVAFLCTLAGSWYAFPAVLSTVASTVVATWAVLDVWVTRQVWVQRNGVQSQPSSTARELRRERRRARRQQRREARENPSGIDRAAA
ncbi:hypothetical protein ACFTZI_29970 [Streptomyces decoyicus]|uniref:hypothetical protein n=1 Tax=Streptomyces decoyicus TaxID=249567 RepID=UPI00363DC93D